MLPRFTSLAVLATSLSIPAQTAWTLRTPANAPPAYTAHAMTYFLPTNSTVLFGGVVGGVRSSDTWIWNGSDWSQATPATVPAARVAHTMVYDINRGRLVMFGGLDATGGLLGDTWEWDGNDWLLMAPLNSPSARRSHCMTFHPTRGTTVLFGGYANGDLNDMWEWDGNDWSSIATSNSPSPRRASDMAWDSVTDDVILFSGYQQAADTWSFDGTDWTQLTPTTAPSARYDHSMVTDRTRDRIVLLGNFSVGDTWEWDGSDWVDRTAATPPSPRTDTYLAYDWVREEVTMFGSVAAPETWSYSAVTPATFTVLGGGGCPGSSGLPPVMSSFDRPWLDEPFEITINQLPANGIGLMISGLSDTNSSIGPLPVSLAIIGMPGCLLSVDPVIIDAVFATGTTATWVLNMPNDPALLGQQFFSQCGALDIGINAAGIIVGNYGLSTIGGK
ncbi:MAG: hypothetical protein ACI89X_000568 [Planctomycetota bacterium]|jgi:hypothetical protein